MNNLSNSQGLTLGKGGCRREAGPLLSPGSGVGVGQAPAGATRAQQGPEGGGPSAGRGLLLPLRPRVTTSPGPRHPPEERRSQESRPRIRLYNRASNPANTGVSETAPERRDPGTDPWWQSAGRPRSRGARPPEAQRRGPAAGWGLRRRRLPHEPVPPGLVPLTLRGLCSFFADRSPRPGPGARSSAS